MKNLIRPRNRRLLFRSFLVLVGGLFIIAIVLDVGFNQLQSRQDPDLDRWLEPTFHLIEQQLAQTSIEQREQVAATLSNELDIGVQLLERDDVHMSQISEHRLPALVDDNNNTSYLHDAESINAIIRLGPIAEPNDSPLLNWLPPIFYLSIFAVVGLWLRPLLKDINVISDGAQRFAADYREPLTTAEHTSELTALAKNLDEMAARLSSVLSSQKELIAALSHEMRTPLARIRFALAVVGNRDDKELQQRLVDVNEDVQEIDNLIAAMLNYARLDHPDISMNWRAVPTSAWLEQILNKFRSDQLEVALDTEKAPDKVWMDSHLMELALNNLLINACHYGGQHVHCTLALVKNEYMLSVEDDGKGIPAEDSAQVFKAFVRIDDSRNRETGGYGLGLAVVARVAELHGGTAIVNSSPSLGGARFSINWPYQQSHSA